ncbi:MAG TPA: aldo/keto reductase [Terracidiphilus sp.]|jgi:aryl-alcohol dehydrogenase-like predicted oxidoreductase|nr:aldo/keto reductase [Terracidiphilus sp.]
MSPFSRREFLKTSVAAGAAAASVGSLPLQAANKRSATDLVTLGKANIQVTRLAFGTGSNNGHVQYGLGQKEFSKLVAYGYERGIRFFETAEAYMTPAMLGEALKPFPRESYVLMSKVTTDEGVDPRERFDEMRRTSQTEYFDIMLLHWQHTDKWVSETSRWQDGILEEQHKKTIRSRGASVHGLPALRQMPGNPWLQVAMIRMNHNGTRMDGPTYADNNNPDHRDEVVAHVKQVKSDGMGVVSMKLVGDTTFVQHSDRQAAMRFAFQNAGVDSVTVGFKNNREIDEAIDNLNLALV